MAHAYSRSGGGAPTEVQQPPLHEYSREQPLTLPPISAYPPPSQYPPQQGHYDPRYQDGRAGLTLPSIHAHAHQPPPHHQQQPPQPYQNQSRGPQEGAGYHRPAHEGYHPYPSSERPLHLQQSQAQKYATLPSSPYVPSRTLGHLSENGRAMKKISQRRGERGADEDRGALPHKTDPSLPSSLPSSLADPQLGRTLYANAPPRGVVAQQQGTQTSPLGQVGAGWRLESQTGQHLELQARDIRKRSASGESVNLLDPSIPQNPVAKKMQLSSLVDEPAGSQPPPASSIIYHLTMRQQPLSARACGFGERDRRVIDPPPILQLTLSVPPTCASPPTPAQLAAHLKNPYYVVHCSLWSADHDVENSTMDDISGAGVRGSGSGQRRLMGTLVSSPFVGLDEHGALGTFFCFPDLSCRTTGRYRLKFSMVLLDPKEMRIGDRRPFVGEAMSGVVTVFAAKDFPGMRSSSRLTRRLKEQGCLISVKKGIERVGERKGRGVGVKGEDGEGEGEGEGHVVEEREEGKAVTA